VWGARRLAARRRRRIHRRGHLLLRAATHIGSPGGSIVGDLPFRHDGPVRHAVGPDHDRGWRDLAALCPRSAVTQPVVPRLDDLEFDSAHREVRRGQIRQLLTPKEFAVLERLMARAPAAVSRAELREHCWDEFSDPPSDVVDVVVNQLRRKLGQPHLIETVRGFGHRAVGISLFGLSGMAAAGIVVDSSQREQALTADLEVTTNADASTAAHQRLAAGSLSLRRQHFRLDQLVCEVLADTVWPQRFCRARRPWPEHRPLGGGSARRQHRAGQPRRWRRGGACATAEPARMSVQDGEPCRCVCVVSR
jgi:DNA-binding response OmpR family regulator